MVPQKAFETFQFGYVVVVHFTPRFKQRGLVRPENLTRVLSHAAEDELTTHLLIALRLHAALVG